MNNVSNIEQYLKENESLTYTFKGTSMNPMLKQGRDLYTVVPKTSARCKKYDVVLYRRAPKQYVLHRIVAVEDKGYITQGDNCVSKEYGIRDEDIIGILTTYKHKNRVISVTDWQYRLYVYIWTLILHPFFIFLERIKAKLSCIIRRLFHDEDKKHV